MWITLWTISNNKDLSQISDGVHVKHRVPLYLRKDFKMDIIDFWVNVIKEDQKCIKEYGYSNFELRKETDNERIKRHGATRIRNDVQRVEGK